jgi:hypothetical protein
MKILSGHDSPETAYIIDDYPSGFHARCRKRIWVETKQGFGQRACYQTSGKSYTGAWCAVKKGTYNLITVLYIDETTGYVEINGISGNWPEKTEEFYIWLGTEGFKALTDIQANTLAGLLARIKAQKLYSTFESPTTEGQKAEVQDLYREEKKNILTVRKESATV